MQTQQLGKLKLLCIFRHGPTGPDLKFVTRDGQVLIERLGYYLKSHYDLKLQETLFVSSKETRTVRSMQHLIEATDLQDADADCDRVFFSNDTVCNVQGAVQSIESLGDKYKNLIVVSHLELTALLPREFGRKVFGINDFPLFSNVPYCKGFLIDCEKKTCDFVDPANLPR